MPNDKPAALAGQAAAPADVLEDILDYGDGPEQSADALDSVKMSED